MTAPPAPPAPSEAPKGRVEGVPALPERPRRRPDLRVSAQVHRDEKVWIVKDPAARRFYRLREAENFFFERLDGTRSVPELVAAFGQETGASVATEEVEGLVRYFAARGLLDVPGAAPAGPRSAFGPAPLWMRILSLKLRTIDPDRFVGWLAARTGWLFHPAVVWACAAVIVLGVLLAAASWGELSTQISGWLSWKGVAALWIGLFVIIFLHELAHAVTCKHFGGEVHEMGFLLLWFQPCCYCDVSDAWTFPERGRRLGVTLAGIFFQAVVWTFTLALWRVLDPALPTAQICYLLTMLSGVSIILNVNPLIKLDGYYLLSDWLEIPNLRARAFRYLGRRFMAAAFGAAMPDDAGIGGPRERRIYGIYGVLGLGYSLLLLAAVAWWLEGLLVRSWGPWGLAAFATILTVVFGPAVVHGLAMAGAVLREGEKSVWRRKRVWTTLALVAAALGWCLFGRMELTVTGEFQLVPGRSAAVRTPVAGRVARVLIKEGDRVAVGTLLARLDDLELQAERTRTGARLQEAQAEVHKFEAGPRPEEKAKAAEAVKLAETRVAFAEKSLARVQGLFEKDLSSKDELEKAQQELAVRRGEVEEARSSLRLIEAGTPPEDIEGARARVKALEADLALLDRKLTLTEIKAAAAGVVTTPHPEELEGRMLQPGDTVCEVEPVDRLLAEIAVPEKELGDVEKGMPVEFKVRAFPDRTFAAHVDEVAPRVTVSEGPRTITVRAVMANPGSDLRAGMTGEARIQAGRRPVVAVLAHRFVRFLRVEFWW